MASAKVELEARRPEAPDYEPQTPLGKRLWALRKKIIASGEPLLDWDDVERELAERRGQKEPER
jgi:hypothetical protein